MICNKYLEYDNVEYDIEIHGRYVHVSDRISRPNPYEHYATSGGFYSDYSNTWEEWK